METIYNPYFLSFLERNIKEAREINELLKPIDRIEYLKREIEITEAEIFLAKNGDTEDRDIQD